MMNSLTCALGRSRFETEIFVRPDDIDMFQHVHNSRHMDYVLAARHEQMERCYKMSMQEFIHAGYGWVVAAVNIEYRRPLVLDDIVSVQTWVDEILEKRVKVRFEMFIKKNGKLSNQGVFEYALINLATGMAETIPDWIIAKCRI